MAITHSNIRDASARFRALLIFSCLGLALGIATGFHIETGKLTEQERAHVAAYTAGRAYTAFDLADVGGLREPLFVTTYRTIQTKFPASADAMETATSRALWFPWPPVGVLMGWGLMALYSRFLAFSKSTPE
jgi:hypothetical protein